MALSVMALSIGEGDAVYYDPAFRTVIETHVNLLRQDPRTQRVTVDPILRHQYEGDFSGYLTLQGISADKHWTYLRVNGMLSHDEFGRDLDDPNAPLGAQVLYMVSLEALEELRQLYLTQQR